MNKLDTTDKYGMDIHLGDRVTYKSKRYGRVFARVLSMHIYKYGHMVKGNWTHIERVSLRVQTEPTARHKRGYWTPLRDLKIVEVI